MDESNEPVAAAVVSYDLLRIQSELEHQTLKKPSDANGPFSIAPFLKGGVVYLEAQTSGYRFSATREVYTGHTGLKLREPLNLNGKILDSETGMPVEEFEVIFWQDMPTKFGHAH